MSPRQPAAEQVLGVARRGRVPARVANEPPNGSRPLRIGNLASQTDVTVEALRYYERLGLLPPPRRRDSGYREYPPDAPRLVRLIKRAQSLGFTLAEVRELVRLRERAWAGDATQLLRTATVDKISDIDHRVRELRALRRELVALVEECDTACPVLPVQCSGTSTETVASNEAPTTTNDPLECPLVGALDGDEPERPRSKRTTRRARSTRVHPTKPGGGRKR